MCDDYDDEFQEEEEKEWRKEYKTADELLEDVVEVEDRWSLVDEKIKLISSKEPIAEGVLRLYQLRYALKEGEWATQDATIAATSLREFAEIYVKEVHNHELSCARLKSIEEQPLKPGVLSMTNVY